MSGNRRRGGKRLRTRTVRSAGGVVLRDFDDGPHALLIATHGGERWSLPKGRIERNESAESAALREVEEETAIRAEIVVPLETIEYWFYARRDLRFHKFVDYFLMRYLSGEPRPQLSEVEAAQWWPIAAALEAVTYRNDRMLLEQAHELWPAGG